MTNNNLIVDDAAASAEKLNDFLHLCERIVGEIRPQQEGQSKECCLCHNEMEDMDVAVTGCCTQIACKACFTEWFLNRKKSECPFCRKCVDVKTMSVFLMRSPRGYGLLCRRQDVSFAACCRVVATALEQVVMARREQAETTAKLETDLVETRAQSEILADRVAALENRVSQLSLELHAAQTNRGRRGRKRGTGRDMSNATNKKQRLDD